jgi:signal transduction histidine kinase
VIVHGDHDRLGQVITNFISNAIKYSPQADEITIQTSVDKGMVTLAVQDYGLGLSKIDQAKVFERFYRVSGSDQNTYPGLGLGLYISSEIIQRHKGRIWVESTKVKGSTFCFSLPISKKKTVLKTQPVS